MRGNKKNLKTDGLRFLWNNANISLMGIQRVRLIMAASEYYVECSGGSQPCDLETIHISTLEPFDAKSFVSTSFLQTLEQDSAPVTLIWNLAL